MDIFTNAAGLSVLAVVAVHQILKMNFIPLTVANKYPVPTNVVLSVIASVVVAVQGGVHLTDWTSWILLIATISVSSAIVFNATIANIKSLKPTITETPLTFLPHAPVPADPVVASQVVVAAPTPEVPTSQPANL
jgi:hypothetical protein